MAAWKSALGCAVGWLNSWVWTPARKRHPTHLVWQETVTSTEFIEDPQAVREYSLAYAEVTKAALDPNESTNLIKQVIKETTP